MKLSIVAGATSQSINVFIQNSSSTTGAGLTGLVFNSGSLTAYYSFTGTNAGSVQIVLATLAAVNSAYSSGGFKEIDATNMPGWYRLDLPNTALATGKGRCVDVHLRGATNMADCPIEIELTGWDNQNATNGGISALPATACTTNASLITSGTGTDQLSVSAGKVLLQATQTGVTIPTVTTVTNQLTAAQIATGVWQDATAGDFTVASSIGKSLYTSGVVPGAAGGLFIAGTNAATTVNITGTLSTVTTVTNQLTAAQIATGVWQDSTAGDFTVASSIGKSLYTSGVAPGASGGLFIAGSNATTTVNFTGNLSGSVGSVTAAVTLSAADSPTITTGTATAGSANTITLQTALGADNISKGARIKITSGTGSKQERVITNYVDATKVVTVDWNWTTTPDATSVYAILYDDAVALNSSLQVVSSSVQGNVTGSVGSISGVTFPTGFSTLTTTAIATAVWQDSTSGDFTVASSIGKSLYTSGVVPGASGGLFIAGTNAATTVTTSFTTTFTGSLTGDVQGKVLGGGASAITGVGANVNVSTVTSGVIATDVWDAARSSHVVAGSFGRAVQPIRDGTAQGGGATSITLDSGADSTHNNFYNNCLIEIIGGTGVGQSRFITAYTASTRVATVSTWTVNPDATSVFVITPFDAIPGATAPTAAQNATAVWTDLLSGTDFSTAGSIGALLKLAVPNAAPGASGGIFIAGTNAATTVTTSFTTTFTGNLTGSVGSISGVTFPSGFSTLTTAAIATAIWTDTTASDFTTLSSPGKILVAQLGGTFTTTSSSVFTAASLVNAPTAPTTAQIATAVWQDATAGDFTVASSIGKSLYTSGIAPGANGGHLISGTNTGPLSVSGGVTFSNSGGDAFVLTSTGGGGNGLNASGNAGGSGIATTGGATGGSGIIATGGTSLGAGIAMNGGSTSGPGLIIQSTNGNGITVQPGGSHFGLSLTQGISITAAASGNGIQISGGATSGAAISLTNTSGNVVSVTGNVNITTLTTTFTGSLTGDVQGKVLGGGASTITGIGADVQINGYASGQDPATLVLGATASSWNAAGTIGAKINSAGSLTPPTTAQIATAIWQDLTSSSDFTTAGSIGKLIVTNLDTNVGSRPTTSQIASAILLTPAHLLNTDTSGNVVLASNGFSNIIPEPNAGLTIDARQALGLILDAACFGFIAGLPTSPATISSPDNTKQRAQVAFDAADNRTGITFLNLP